MTKKTTRHHRQPTNLLIIRSIRYALLLPIIYALGSLMYAAATKGLDGGVYSMVGQNLQIIGMSAVAIGVTFLFARLEKDMDIHLPKVLLSSILLLVVGALVAGEAFGLYLRFWWWDDVLHTLSGVIMGFVGFLVVYLFNARYSMRMSPLFVALFSLSFAVTAGVLWEALEFSLDVAFKMDTQRWSLPPETPLLGRSYQGSGLRDTMSDLIVATVGAGVASLIAYRSYKHERAKTLNWMQRTFPGLNNKKKR